MANLTKEYLDKQFKTLATKEGLQDVKKDVAKLASRVDGLTSKVDGLASKKDLEDQIEGLATMVQREFVALNRKLDVRERVEKLEQEMQFVKQALNITRH